MEVVLREDIGRVAWLRMNRVERRNALSTELIDALLEQLSLVRADDSIGAVVLTGNGKAFCAGGDLAGGMGESGGFLESHNNRASFGELLKTIQTHPKPVIAALNGDALGGGFGLAMACDLVVASDEARMGTPEIRLGLFPHVILAVLKKNIGRKALVEMILTGEKFGMEQATKLGIVNRIAPADKLEEVALELAQLVASRSPAVLALGKSAFNAIDDMNFDQALNYMHTQLTLNLLTEDAMEGVAAFLQKRAPEWRGR